MFVCFFIIITQSSQICTFVVSIKSLKEKILLTTVPSTELHDKAILGLNRGGGRDNWVWSNFSLSKKG